MRLFLIKISLLTFTFLPILGHAQWQTRITPGGRATDIVEIKGHFFTLNDYKVYRSTNYGQSWHITESQDTNPTFFQILADEDTLYAAGSRIFRSINLGKTWQEVLPAPYFWSNGYRLLGANKGRLYWQEHDALLELKPGAIQWDTLATFVVGDGIKLAFYEEFVFIATWHYLYRYDRLTQTFDGYLYSPAYNIFFWQGNLLSGNLFSTDLGLTWNTVSDIPDLRFITESEGILYGINGTDIWKSENLMDWTLVNKINSPQNPVKLAVSGQVIIANSDYGLLMRSTDQGENWKVNNSGLPSPFPACFATKTRMSTFLQSEVNLTSDACKNWSAPMLNGNLMDIFVEKNGKIFTITYSNGIWSILKSNFEMQEWEVVSDLPTSFGANFIKLGDKLVYFSNKIMVSEDDGLTWTEEGTLPQSGDFVDYHKENLIATDGNNGGLALSADLGHNWQDITPAGTNAYKVVSAGNYIYTYSDFFLYGSNDLGNTWTNLTALVPNPSVLFYAFTAKNDSLFVAKNDSIFFSPNFGQSWVNITENLNLQSSCDALRIFNGELIAMSFDGTVAALPFSSINNVPIEGVVFHDQNNDGIQDIDEKGLDNFMVRNTAQDAFAFTDTAGFFQLMANFEADSAYAVVPWDYATSNPEIFPVIPDAPDLHFGIYFDPNAKDLCIAISATTAFVPGFDAKLILTVKNLGPTVQDASVKLRLDDQLNFVESIPTQINVDGNTIEWFLPNLAPFQMATIELICYVLPSLVAGNSVTLSASVSPIDGDANKVNNYDRTIVAVRSSFDPNDKMAHTGDLYSTLQYAENEPINYTVRFQNTGNYPAQFVRIVDTLDAKFDLNSFTLLANSHPVSIQIVDENQLVFLFSDINLADSTTSEPQSHGFLTYSLTPKTGLSIGSVFRNTAHIYFDYNLPINTNTVNTTLSLPLEIHEINKNGMSLWPNPSNGRLNIQFKSSNLYANELLICDLLGQVLIENKLTIGSQVQALDCSNLPIGLYFLGVKIDGKVIFKEKFIKI
jgi:uncharacterized repeat protein (TIGR01451 family)